MLISTEAVDIPASDSPMRSLVCSPKMDGAYPGILLYSDIFQLTGPTIRACARLAGYGFVVIAPEIYHRIEPPGTVIAFDDAGRTQGMDDAGKTTVTEFDSDARSAFDWLAKHPKVAEGNLGAAGFCIGGHLAFRAAFQPDCRATACFYPTGVHNGKLGRDIDSGTLGRVKEIQGDLLLVFGTRDPHVPDAGRAAIQSAVDVAGLESETVLYEAEHAFMRDEGPRYDPEATDLAFAEMIGMFRRVFD